MNSSKEKIKTGTVRELTESARSGVFTRVKTIDSNPNIVTNEYVYGQIDCPDCQPFRGSILFGTQGAVPFLSYDNLKIVHKLKSFCYLEANWNSYGADKPSHESIEQAINFVRQIDECGIVVYFVAPGPNGEILVELNKNNKGAEIYFSEGQPVEYLLFPQQEDTEPTVMINSSDFVKNVWLPFAKN